MQYSVAHSVPQLAHFLTPLPASPPTGVTLMMRRRRGGGAMRAVAGVGVGADRTEGRGVGARGEGRSGRAMSDASASAMPASWAASTTSEHSGGQRKSR